MFHEDVFCPSVLLLFFFVVFVVSQWCNCAAVFLPLRLCLDGQTEMTGFHRVSPRTTVQTLKTKQKIFRGLYQGFSHLLQSINEAFIHAWQPLCPIYFQLFNASQEHQSYLFFKSIETQIWWRYEHKLTRVLTWKIETWQKWKQSSGHWSAEWEFLLKQIETNEWLWITVTWSVGNDRKYAKTDVMQLFNLGLNSGV